jgi:hypothetical protein
LEAAARAPILELYGTDPSSEPTRAPALSTEEDSTSALLVSVQVDGPASSLAAVTAAVRDQYFTRMKRCYFERSNEVPGLRARAAVQFTILETGRASQARVFVTPDDPVLANCLGGLVPYWTFPRPIDYDGNPRAVEAVVRVRFQPSREAHP